MARGRCGGSARPGVWLVEATRHRRRKTAPNEMSHRRYRRNDAHMRVACFHPAAQRKWPGGGCRRRGPCAVPARRARSSDSGVHFVMLTFSRSITSMTREGGTPPPPIFPGLLRATWGVFPCFFLYLWGPDSPHAMNQTHPRMPSLLEAQTAPSGGNATLRLEPDSRSRTCS